MSFSKIVVVILLLVSTVTSSMSVSAMVPATKLSESDLLHVLSALQSEVSQLQNIVETKVTPARSLAAIISEKDLKRIEYLKKKITQTNARITSITAELALVRVKLAAAKAVTGGEVTPPVVAPPTTAQKASYRALTGSYVLESKDAVTEADAQKSCIIITAATPLKNVWCSWNKKVISGQKPKAFVLGVATTAEILELESQIASLEKSLAKNILYKSKYEAELVKLQGTATSTTPIVVPQVITPPVVAPPIVKPPVVVPPKEITPTSTSGKITPAICGSKPYARKVVVTNNAELKSALTNAVSGDYIALSAGTYSDTFVLENKLATASNPISICGDNGAMIKAPGGYVGYGFHFKNVTSFVLSNVVISGYLKGVVLDNGDNSIIQNITVSNLGNEGVHFRTGSSNNIIQKSTIFDTGFVEDWFGEGVYIGSANSNWCKYGTNCGPDKSDYNQVIGNTIYRTSAESIDVKEGSTGGLIIGNSFEGSGMTGEYADSFIDVKGNNYLIKNNTGTIAFNAKKVSYQLDGYQHHVVYDGYGNNNVFEANTVTGALPGNVVYIQSKGVGNIVYCNNTAIPVAAKGMTNAKICK